VANKEACELYIEQEIRSALNKGKKPYSIGKELSKWVEKLFEAHIPAKTIESRAYRQNTSNEVKKSNNIDNSVVYKSDQDSITHPITARGGKREGAGRPQSKWKKTHKLFKNHIYEANLLVEIMVKDRDEWMMHFQEISNLVSGLSFKIKHLNEGGRV